MCFCGIMFAVETNMHDVDARQVAQCMRVGVRWLLPASVALYGRSPSCTPCINVDMRKDLGVSMERTPTLNREGLKGGALSNAEPGGFDGRGTGRLPA